MLLLLSADASHPHPHSHTPSYLRRHRECHADIIVTCLNFFPKYIHLSIFSTGNASTRAVHVRKGMASAPSTWAMVSRHGAITTLSSPHRICLSCRLKLKRALHLTISPSEPNDAGHFPITRSLGSSKTHQNYLHHRHSKRRCRRDSQKENKSLRLIQHTVDSSTAIRDVLSDLPPAGKLETFQVRPNIRTHASDLIATSNFRTEWGTLWQAKRRDQKFNEAFETLLDMQGSGSKKLEPRETEKLGQQEEAGEDAASNQMQPPKRDGAQRSRFDRLISCNGEETTFAQTTEHGRQSSSAKAESMTQMRLWIGRWSPARQPALSPSRPIQAIIGGMPTCKAYHTTSRSRQEAIAPTGTPSAPPPDLTSISAKPAENQNGIRAQLRRWQELHGHEHNLKDDVFLDGDGLDGNFSNNLVRLPDRETQYTPTQAEQEEGEEEAMAHFMHSSSEDSSSVDTSIRFLRMGDLVELLDHRSDRGLLVGVFVRRFAGISQFYTMHGRWVHAKDKLIQYSIPGWVSKDLVEPLIPYLPAPEDVKGRYDELMEDAYMKDLSVPRQVATPLIARMVNFYDEAQEIYRKNARSLDNAHEILAHDSHLRYGSLQSAASTLLGVPVASLSTPALFTVRQALTNAGFAFSIDLRSHRLTGYLQIRSKKQVSMVERVRQWLREWQDDLAQTAGMDEKQRSQHRPSEHASYVYSFLDKAREIVKRSREHRDPTPYGIVGPSKVQFELGPGQDCVKVTKEPAFNKQDSEILRFMEAWCLSNMFAYLPRLQALPPLILQATGLYDGYSLRHATGSLMLQELGTIMPYENRVRFDPNLLLPSSEHSKPLQNLMKSIANDTREEQFVDSMKHLRHDWKDMPVYCIDDAAAEEIDDGLSIEPVANHDSELKEWWVHIHIANPTAFFSKDHPMAKMAKHMGESVYMPERSYMMLPRWSTQNYFSLSSNRPCLTFSARLDQDGNTLERKITPGIIRNVFRLTRPEVAELMGVSEDDGHPEQTFVVGGTPPPPRPRRSQMGDIKEKNVQELRWLTHLGVLRKGIRQKAGGIFFETHKPEVKVWQRHSNPGLAWDTPYRHGWRRVEGDPVIQVKTKGFLNWFTAADSVVDLLVREHMLLACEVAAYWCEERQIPAIFRGTVEKPDTINDRKAVENVMASAVTRSPNSQWPMHLGIDYLKTFATTVLSTRPFKHDVIGMQKYGKVTSPLRRYGDMITHWQIEAALRQEALTGRSLVTADPNADRSFLPFSRSVLETIIVGLQPRESTITKAKQQSEAFWLLQLLFRLIHVPMSHPSNQHPGTTPLPFPTIRAASLPQGQAAISRLRDIGAAADTKWDRDVRVCHAYVFDVDLTKSSVSPVHVFLTELNIQAQMQRPELCGLGELRPGDIWECWIDEVQVYRRTVILAPIRCVERADD